MWIFRPVKMFYYDYGCYILLQYFQTWVILTKLDIYVFITIDTFAAGLLIPCSIFLPVVRTSALTWFIIYLYIYSWKWQSLNIVIIIKTLRFSSLRHMWPYPILAFLFKPFGFLPANFFLNNWLSNLSQFERTWWRLSQKRVVCTRLDIYVFLPTRSSRR